MDPGVVPRHSDFKNLDCQTTLSATTGAKGILPRCKTQTSRQTSTAVLWRTRSAAVETSSVSPASLAFAIASINCFAGNGLFKYATPRSMACRRWLSSSDPVMKMMGKAKPVAARWRPKSTPEMSPSWMSTTRHDASVVIAARTNSSADAYVSVTYPNTESMLSNAWRIPGSSSMIATTFLEGAITLLDVRWLPGSSVPSWSGTRRRRTTKKMARRGCG